MGIDCVRLDFFISKGHAMAVGFNEDSISSARDPTYRHVYRYIDKLWVEPHLKKWYKPFNTTKRTYEMSRFEPGAPNIKRVNCILGTSPKAAVSDSHCISP
mmetsp:Transcript_59902/g.133506  ORF Transcript_59902/g.133506 Transcript_59902/m.133506 type:complete len:101 (-) Transcript_59902:421-723(-)